MIARFSTSYALILTAVLTTAIQSTVAAHCGAEDDSLTPPVTREVQRAFDRVEELINACNWMELFLFLHRIYDMGANSFVRHPRYHYEYESVPDYVTYVNAQEYVRHKMAMLPAEAISEYRIAYDWKSETKYRTALTLRANSNAPMKRTSREILREIAGKYSLTSCGDEALWTLITWDIEVGNLREAAKNLEYMFDAYDSFFEPCVPQAIVAAKLALCYSRLGYAYKLDSLRKKIATLYPDAKVVTNGVDLPLSTFVQSLTRPLVPSDAPAQESTEWLNAFGNTSGTALMPGIPPGASLSRLYTRPFPESELATAGDEGEWNYHYSSLTQRVSHFVRLGPVIFINMFRYGAAFDLQTGDFLWSTAIVRKLRRKGVIDPDLKFQRLCLVLPASSDGQKLFFPRRLIMSGNQDAAHPPWSPNTVVVMLSFPKPKLHWLYYDSREDGDEAEAGRIDGILSPVLPTLQGCFFIADIDGAFYLIALAPDGSKVLWRTLIIKGAQRVHYDRPFQPVSLVASESHVFCCLNFRIIACVEAATGRMEWLSKYSPKQHSHCSHYSSRDDIAAHYSQCIAVSEGLVMTMPRDSTSFYIFDEISGKLLSDPKRFLMTKRSRSDFYYHKPSRTVYLVEGNAIKPVHIDGEQFSFGRSIEIPEAVNGRGGVSQNGLYLPGRKGLYHVQIRPDGSFDDDISQVLNWDDLTTSPRFVGVFEDYIVMVTREGFSVFGPSMPAPE